MKSFGVFRFLKQLLIGREPQRAAPVEAEPVAPPVQQPLNESLVELNAAMRTLDQEMLRLAQAWQSLGASLESLKEQKSRSEAEAAVFGRIDTTRLN